MHHDDTPLDTATLRQQQHATALQLRELARHAQRALLVVMAHDDVHGPDTLAELDAAERALSELAELARHAAVQLPDLERVRRGIDRLACHLYHSGACDTLDEDEREAFLNRHAQGLTTLDGIGPVTARRLFAHGISDPERLRELDPAALDDVEGLSGAVLARLRESLTATE